VPPRGKFKTKPCVEGNSFKRMAFDVDILSHEHHSKSPKDTRESQSTRGSGTRAAFDALGIHPMACCRHRDRILALLLFQLAAQSHRR
jgi:hypothetical protein